MNAIVVGSNGNVKTTRLLASLLNESDERVVKLEAMRVSTDAAGWPSAVVCGWSGGLGLNDELGARIVLGDTNNMVYARPGDWIVRVAP